MYGLSLFCGAVSEDDGELVLPFHGGDSFSVGCAKEQVPEQVFRWHGADVDEVSASVAVLGYAWPLSEEGVVDVGEWLCCGGPEEFCPHVDAVVGGADGVGLELHLAD